MGWDLAEADDRAREVFDTADRILEFPLSRICFEGPEEELRRTAVTQPALLAASVAAARLLESRGLRPEAVAGHSLGEYSALVVAGALPFEEAVRAVHLRGRFMQEAVPEGMGAMAAIIGLEGDAAAAVCREAAGSQVVSPANLNAPGQVVIAGHREAVDRAVELARERGARKAVPLNVSAPFHCALMEPAAARLAEVLAEISFADARIPVWVNVDAAPETEGGRLREALLRQVASPVRWEESLLSLSESGFHDFLEVGPGTVLAGLVKRTLRKTAAIRPAGTLEAIQGLQTAAS
jgi:[acyl-carrier-protein] S-malonyltransferase